MKRLHFIVIMVTLLLSQWGTIEHAFHKHDAGEVCDYCISAKSFNHALTSSVQLFVPEIQKQNPEVPVLESHLKTTRHFYSVRAPPRFS